MNQYTYHIDLKKLKALMVVRLILVTVALVAGSLILRVERIPFYSIIAVFYFATLIYSILIYYKFPLHILAYIQIIIDTILETIIIHYSGGADSVFVFLYAVSIISAGIMISSRAAKMIAGFGSVLYGLLAILEFTGIISPVATAELFYKEGYWVMTYIVSFKIIVICLIGYLSSYLSSHLYQEHSALMRLRNLTDLILNNIASGVITIDSQDRIIYINPMGISILGSTQQEVINSYWPNLFWEKIDKDKINDFLENAKTDKGMEFDITRLDGKKRILGCNYSFLSDEKNKIVGGVITFRDLTIVKELELEIRQREKLSAMGELAINIAHELRNPLASMKGSLEVLKERGCFQDESGKLVEIIFKESNRLNKIIEDFLKYARNSKPRVKRENIVELLEEVWLLLKHQGRWSQDIDLKKNIIPKKIILSIDPEQMKQVFYNILINSLESMPKGGKIYVNMIAELKNVKIIIKDTGCGFLEKDEEKVFRHLYSTKVHGSGIGLTITKRIIESHGGKITIKSSEKSGTEVTIILPKNSK